MTSVVSSTEGLLSPVRDHEHGNRRGVVETPIAPSSSSSSSSSETARTAFKMSSRRECGSVNDASEQASSSTTQAINSDAPWESVRQRKMAAAAAEESSTTTGKSSSSSSRRPNIKDNDDERQSSNKGTTNSRSRSKSKISPSPRQKSDGLFLLPPRMSTDPITMKQLLLDACENSDVFWSRDSDVVENSLALLVRATSTSQQDFLSFQSLRTSWHASGGIDPVVMSGSNGTGTGSSGSPTLPKLQDAESIDFVPPPSATALSNHPTKHLESDAVCEQSLEHMQTKRASDTAGNPKIQKMLDQFSPDRSFSSFVNSNSNSNNNNDKSMTTSANSACASIGSTAEQDFSSGVQFFYTSFASLPKFPSITGGREPAAAAAAAANNNNINIPNQQQPQQQQQQQQQPPIIQETRTKNDHEPSPYEQLRNLLSSELISPEGSSSRHLLIFQKDQKVKMKSITVDLLEDDQPEANKPIETVPEETTGKEEESPVNTVALASTTTPKTTSATKETLTSVTIPETASAVGAPSAPPVTSTPAEDRLARSRERRARRGLAATPLPVSTPCQPTSMARNDEPSLMGNAHFVSSPITQGRQSGRRRAASPATQPMPTPVAPLVQSPQAQVNNEPPCIAIGTGLEPGKPSVEDPTSVVSPCSTNSPLLPLGSAQESRRNRKTTALEKLQQFPNQKSTAPPTPPTTSPETPASVVSRRNRRGNKANNRTTASEKLYQLSKSPDPDEGSHHSLGSQSSVTAIDMTGVVGPPQAPQGGPTETVGPAHHVRDVSQDLGFSSMSASVETSELVLDIDPDEPLGAAVGDDMIGGFTMAIRAEPTGQAQHEPVDSAGAATPLPPALRVNNAKGGVPRPEAEFRPGAYVVQGRALGEVPAWIREAEERRQRQRGSNVLRRRSNQLSARLSSSCFSTSRQSSRCLGARRSFETSRRGSHSEPNMRGMILEADVQAVGPSDSIHSITENHRQFDAVPPEFRAASAPPHGNQSQIPPELRDPSFTISEQTETSQKKKSKNFFARLSKIADPTPHINRISKMVDPTPCLARMAKPIAKMARPITKPIAKMTNFRRSGGRK